ncbi:ATP-binding protein [Streptomyces sp. NPDC054904]|uniref:ATP-binding protein n=1 Tax=unclassified Streptomyces TaxID=2593676 RepID=UPI00248200B2|nr:ATP-binding protein [Streptomyces sp. Isolate_45]MDA5284360.1 ATP-binding protein [Streptomyces sp. Isolate_45]
MRPFRAGLLALPEEVAALRRAVRAHVDAPCHDLQLCVSELVGNVIAHVGEGTPVSLAVTRTPDGRTRVEVGDPDPRVWPVLREAADTDESGRGLAVLDAVAVRWGVRPGPTGGKTVWAELAHP